MPSHRAKTSNKTTQYRRMSSPPAQTSRAKPQDVAKNGGGSWKDEVKFEVLRYYREGYSFNDIGLKVGRSAVACRIIKKRMKDGSKDLKRMVEQAELEREKVFRKKKAKPQAAVEEDQATDDEDQATEDEDQATVDEDNAGSEKSSPSLTNQISGTNNLSQKSVKYSLREWNAAISLIRLSGGGEISEDEMVAQGVPQVLLVKRHS